MKTPPRCEPPPSYTQHLLLQSSRKTGWELLFLKANSIGSKFKTSHCVNTVLHYMQKFVSVVCWQKVQKVPVKLVYSRYWANQILAVKIHLCVCVLTRVAQIVTAGHRLATQHADLVTHPGQLLLDIAPNISPRKITNLQKIFSQTNRQIFPQTFLSENTMQKFLHTFPL